MRFFRALNITIYLHIPIVFLVWSEIWQIADRSALARQGLMGQLFILIAFVLILQSLYQSIGDRSHNKEKAMSSAKSSIQDAELNSEENELLDEEYVSGLPIRVGVAFYVAYLASLKVISIGGWPIVFIIVWPGFFIVSLTVLGVSTAGDGGGSSSAGFSLGGDGGGGD